MKFEDIPEPIRQRLLLDEFICGNSFCLKNKEGTYERIDPMTVVLNPLTKTFTIVDKEVKR